jgi:flagellar hook assembly protein FlgD
VSKTPLSSTIDKFNILPAYPNPFNPITTITYGLNKDSKVTVSIYDITGNIITTLLNMDQEQGWHSIEWNGTDINNKQVPAGVYIGRVTSNEESQTIKLMLLK